MMPVHRRDAEQGDKADCRGDAERRAGEEQREDAADQRHRNDAGGQQSVERPTRNLGIEQPISSDPIGTTIARRSIASWNCRTRRPIPAGIPPAAGPCRRPFAGPPAPRRRDRAAHAEFDRDIALLLLAIDEGGARDQV